MSGRLSARDTVTALTPAILATSASVLRFLRMFPSHESSPPSRFPVSTGGAT
jgi:hypothetical protein